MQQAELILQSNAYFFPSPNIERGEIGGRGHSGYWKSVKGGGACIENIGWFGMRRRREEGGGGGVKNVKA